MINLTSEQLNYIDENSNGVIVINNKKYFFKLIPKLNYGIEIVIEKLANLVNIKCAHYEIVNINGLNYYLSEDIGNNFIKADSLNINSNNIYDIESYLIHNYYERKDYLIYELIKIFFFDILVLNSDRNLENWGILFNGQTPEDIYILDNSSSFELNDPVLQARKNGVLYEESDIKNIPYELEKGIRELNYFLQDASSDIILLLEEMYNILTPETIIEIFQECDLDYKTKMDMINIYKENYYLAGRLLHKRGLK